MTKKKIDLTRRPTGEEFDYATRADLFREHEASYIKLPLVWYSQLGEVYVEEMDTTLKEEKNEWSDSTYSTENLYNEQFLIRQNKVRDYRKGYSTRAKKYGHAEDRGAVQEVEFKTLKRLVDNHIKKFERINKKSITSRMFRNKENEFFSNAQDKKGAILKIHRAEQQNLARYIKSFNTINSLALFKKLILNS